MCHPFYHVEVPACSSFSPQFQYVPTLDYYVTQKRVFTPPMSLLVLCIKGYVIMIILDRSHLNKSINIQKRKILNFNQTLTEKKQVI